MMYRWFPFSKPGEFEVRSGCRLAKKTAGGSSLWNGPLIIPELILWLAPLLGAGQTGISDMLNRVGNFTPKKLSMRY